MRRLVPILFIFNIYVLHVNVAVAQNFTWMSGSNLKNMPLVYDTAGVPSANNSPGGRSYAATWTDNTGNLWFYGGRAYTLNQTNDKADLWKYNTNTNQWTFVTGSTLSGVKAIYGPPGIPSATITPGCRSGSARWTDASGNLWLFGGGEIGAFNFLNDLWMYNPATNEWTFMKGPATLNQPGVYGTIGQSNSSNYPGARSQCAFWKDNAGNLWLFGGYEATTSGTRWFNDLWKYTIATNEWTWMNGSSLKNQFGSYGIKGVSSTTNTPGSRANMVSIAGKNGEFWLYGGNGYGVTGGSGPLNDLWKYEVQNNTWTFLNGSALLNQTAVNGLFGFPDTTNQPGGRQASLGWCDKQGDLWFFGGMSISGTNYNTLWKYTVSDGTWKRMHGSTAANHQGFYGSKLVASPSNTPSARAAAQAWKDTAQNFWLMGGVGPSINGSGYLNDVWKFDYCNTGPFNITSPRPTACIGEELLITVNGATTFTWNNGAGSNPMLVKATTDTLYVVAGIDQAGCLNSSMFIQKTTDCSALVEQKPDSGLNLFPNPGKGHISVYSDDPILEVLISDMTGRVILEEPGQNKNLLTIDTRCTSGLYVCLVKNSNGKTTATRFCVVD